MGELQQMITNKMKWSVRFLLILGDHDHMTAVVKVI